MTIPFGPAWSLLLAQGCASMHTLPEWPLATIALESGFNPLAENANSKARGFFQKMPATVFGPDGKPARAWNLVDKVKVLTGLVVPAGCVELAGGQIVRPYAERDPHKQIVDAFKFWQSMVALFKTEIRSREAFYCLNLAPARLANGKYDENTVLYTNDPAWKGRAEYAPTAYEWNKVCDPPDQVTKKRTGFIRLGRLAVPLDHYIAQNQAKHDLELSMAYVANAAVKEGRFT